MYARVAKYRGAASDDLGALLPHLTARIDRDLDEPPPGLEGLREVFVLVDRERGHALAVTCFDSQDDLERGEQALNHVAMSQGGGVRTEVDHYEVVLRRARR